MIVMSVTTVYTVWGIVAVMWLATAILLYIKGPEIRRGIKKEISSLLKSSDTERILKDPSQFTKRR